ncbi:hypothetical protein DRO32_00075 [Candidatus Bathyarchaeota archaeon]|nr:MAG: hypothetical protein DRO32_00075 [Candidatus Bathyarchaeota archaeon]
MKRGLVLLSVAALGFAILSTIYKLVEPYLPMLPSLIMSVIPIITSGWFIAGLVGALLFVAILVAWAYSGEW